jgi:uncharacterized membrane protein
MNNIEMMLNKQKILQSDKKITPEDIKRKQILSLAEAQGCKQELIEIFEKYDKLLASCGNDVERQEISVMGIAEVHNLLNMQGALVVNGIVILPAKSEGSEIIG